MLLRSLTKHVRNQNWFAVFLDFLIVVVGILIAFQITSWSEMLEQGGLEESYLIRLGGDLDETIDYLSSQGKRSTEIKLIIEKFTAVLNTKDSNDAELIEAIRLYISDGTSLGDFKVNRTTFDDLQATGNLSVLQNKELVYSLGQLHTNFADHDLDALVNTDWILPFESKITEVFDFMRFDKRTQHLFPETTPAEIAAHIRENYDLLQRHAALHYWYVDTISDDYKSAVVEAKVVREMIKTELESR